MATDTIYNKVGQRLRKLREQKGYSLFTLSLKSGVDSSYIWRIEQGTKKPSLEIMKKLARGLDIECFDELFKVKVNP